MLELRKVSKIFRSVEALKDISFRVNGEILGITGPNGAGKTTLMRILATLIAPTEGVVNYRGIADKRRIREVLGYLPEKVAFYWNRTALKNLEYYCRLYEKDIPWDLVEMFDLTERLDIRVREYSKGMIQKLGIVRAFIPSPRILIFDEPTSNLDHRSRMDFLSYIRDYPSDVTVISSHNMEELERVCDRIIFLNRTIVGEIDLRKDVYFRYRIELEKEPEFPLQKFGLEKIKGTIYAITVQKKEDVSRVIEDLVNSGVRIVEVKRENRIQEYYRRLMNEVSDDS